jgi:uncharacterized membrane protein (UPF0127 family)
MVTINKHKILSTIVLFAVLFLFIFLLNRSGNRFHKVVIGGQEIYVNLADTPIEQERGLSGKKNLGEKQGMLFVFDEPGVYPFWMKDMNFPLDIIWIDENSHIIYIQKDAKPDSYPKSFGPNKNSKYVLEVNSGFSNINNIKVGDSVEIIP